MSTIRVDNSFVVGSALIIAEDNGHLRCKEDSTYWCKHIESAVRIGKDAPTVWYLDRYVGVDWAPLEIPIVPTANQWAPVRLSLEKINSVPMLGVDYPGPNADQQNFLGFISEGEGRWVIRSMVYDWFRGVVDPTTIECSSSSHKFPSQMRWEKDMQGQAQVAQLWSVWTTGACLGCTYDTSSANDPDLIPDPGSSPSPFAKASLRGHRITDKDFDSWLSGDWRKSG